MTESFPKSKALRDTAKALLVELDGGEEVWVPKSVIDEDSEVFEPGNTGTLILAQWFCEKNGLEPR